MVSSFHRNGLAIQDGIFNYCVSHFIWEHQTCRKCGCTIKNVICTVTYITSYIWYIFNWPLSSCYLPQQYCSVLLYMLMMQSTTKTQQEGYNGGIVTIGKAMNGISDWTECICMYPWWTLLVESIHGAKYIAYLSTCS